MSEAIRRLVHDYADAVCCGDADAWGATWAPDGVWEMGTLRMEGRTEIVGAWEQAMAGFDQVIHVAYNGSVDLDPEGNAGRGRWYIGEFLAPRQGSPQMLLACYDDAYVNLDGTWLFAARRLGRLYSGPPDLTGDFGGPPPPPLNPQIWKGG